MAPNEDLDDGQSAALATLSARLHGELIADAARTPDGGSVETQIAAVVAREAGLLDAGARAELTRQLLHRSCGLGPLEALLADPEVDEILVCGNRPVFVERHGQLAATSVAFASESELRGAIDRILGPIGRRVDEASPLCDARLPDGSRVNVVMPPLAVDGPTLTIRRFRRGGFDAETLVARQTWTPELFALLAEAVASRASILVSGGTGSGKTTTLGALAGLIDPVERLILIEDTAELQLPQPHLVRLEARPPNVEGRGAVTIRELVRNALRMRPDRIIVGEVRGGEALDMVTAMTTGHDGSLSTVHASSPQAALRRLETLCLMADVGLPHRAVCALVADGLDLVVHQERGSDGRRRVTSVARVVEADGRPVAQSIYQAPDKSEPA